MAHVLKATRGQVGALTRHFERAKNKEGDYIKFSNQEIDTSLSHLNYNLAPEKNQLIFIKKRTDEVQCLNRKDVNVMASWVVTLPKTIKESSLEEKTFFQATYDFLKEKYKEKNIVSAYIHKDETTPHLHFAFIPILYDPKKEVYKVSAKEIITRRHLQTFHQELDSYIEHTLGRNVGILNEATKEGNKSIAELKQATMAQKTLSLENEYQSTKNDLEALQRIYQGALLTKLEVENLTPRKTITGVLKDITLEDIESLKSTALRYHLLEEQLTDLQKENKELIHTIESQNREIQSIENRSQQQTNALFKLYKLKNQYENLTDFLNQLPGELQSTLKDHLSDYNHEQQLEQSFIEPEL